MQRVVQLAHRILQNGLGLGGSAPHHLKLLIQQLLPQPLLLGLLETRGQRLQILQGPGPSSKARRLPAWKTALAQLG